MAKMKKERVEEPIGGWHRMVTDHLYRYNDRQQYRTALRDTLLPKLMGGEVRVESK